MSTPKTSLQPYLFYGGRCDEALAFYKKAIGAETSFVMRFNESPEPMPPGMLAEGFEKKIMHSEFKVGEMTLMASDGCGEGGKFEGFRLALIVPTEADADKAFAGLADGGTVDMPLAQTFWSPRYGQVTDKFGLGWMVMVPAPM